MTFQSRRRVAWACSIVGLLGWALIDPENPEAGLVATEPTAATTDLLLHYNSYVKEFEHFKGIWRVKDYEQRGDEKPRWLGNVDEWTVNRDGNRAKVFSKLIEGKAKSPKGLEEILHGEDRWVSVYPDGSVFSAIKIQPNTLVARLGMSPSSESYGIVNQINIGAFLTNASLSSGQELLKGDETYWIKGVSGDVEIRLWLAPKANFAPVRIWYEDQKLRHSRRYEVTRLAENGGRFVAAEAEVTYVNRPKPVLSAIATEREVDGKVVREHQPERDAGGKIIMAPERRYLREIVLVRLDFDPKFDESDFELTQRIPDGTRVNLKDAPHLAYIWQAGKIVPAINSDTLRMAGEAKFKRDAPPSTLKILVLLLPVGVILAILGYRQMKKGASPGELRHDG